MSEFINKLSVKLADWEETARADDSPGQGNITPTEVEKAVKIFQKHGVPEDVRLAYEESDHEDHYYPADGCGLPVVVTAHDLLEIARQEAFLASDAIDYSPQ